MATERWQDVERLYHEALARPDNDRAAFLHEACVGDADLAREVASLLAHASAASGFLNDAAVNAAATPMSDETRSLIGRQLGVYRVTARLGAGGMGEVFRARDTKLGREVAIKVLPAMFTADRDRLARLEREARMLATLNHPHIGAIYGFEDSDGVQALVLELVEGETLADLIADVSRHKPQGLPVARALVIAGEIAEALEAAHAKSIVHRDLKPANIKITPNGGVKVLDFGLAKTVLKEGSGLDLSQSPTLTVDGTRPGLILGTVAYMSPEQARGKPLDKRADVWAFGCVLYEMLTGMPPFQGETFSDTVAAIIERTPDWKAIRSTIPPAITRLIQHCLEKDISRRLVNIADARATVDKVREAHGPGLQDAQRWSRRAWPWALGVAVAAVVGVVITHLFGSAAPSASPALEMRQITAFPDFATQPSLSADGRMLTFIRGSGSFMTAGQVYVKLLPDGEPVQLTHDTASKMMPVFSPDGSRIAYGVVTPAGSWDTWIVPVLGGQPRLWLPNASGLRWTGPGHLLFSEVKDSGIHMALVTAAESRTESRDVYIPESIRGMVHRSYLSPDRAWAIVAEMDNGGMLPCRIVPFDGRSPSRTVGPPSGQCTHAAWSPDGRAMFFTSNAGGRFQIWRQSFPDGTPQQITVGPTESEGIAMSPDGRSVITSVGFDQGAVWVSDGGMERQVSSEGSALLPAWGDGFPTSVFSPNGRKLYYLVQTADSRGFGSGELWACDLGTGAHEPVLPGITMTSYDISSDGERIVFSSFDADGISRMWLARLDRRAPPAKLPVEGRGPVFGPHNDVYFRGREGKLWYFYTVRLDSGEIAKFSAEPAVNSPTISPDGQWILSLVPVAGKDSTTAVKAFPTSGGDPLTICTSCSLKWTRDQKYLFVSFGFSNGDPEQGTTFVVALPQGKALPELPSGGLASDDEVRKLPVVRTIDRKGLFPGSSESVYAFQRRSVQRNLYRVAIQQ